jgi:hypothetical protein
MPTAGAAIATERPPDVCFAICIGNPYIIAAVRRRRGLKEFHFSATGPVPNEDSK